MKNTKQFEEARERYLAGFGDFEGRLNGQADGAFHALRKEALARFSELGFPTDRDEDWKYTSVKPLLKQPFVYAVAAPEIDRALLEKHALPGLRDRQIVMVNGHYVPQLSTFSATKDAMIVDSLHRQISENADDLLQYFGKFAGFRDEAFVALNTAFAADGLFISIPDRLVVEKPIHLLNISVPGEAGFFAAPRHLFVAGKASKLTVIESYHAAENVEGAYFNNIVSETFVDRDASVHHVRIQNEGPAAFHVCRTQCRQMTGSHYSLVNVDLGGRLVRNNLNIEFGEASAEGELVGLYIGDRRQHLDNHTFIDHAQPHCLSTELYKGVLGGKAQGVFNGKVMVRQDAQKTNAYQQNQALLLTDDAGVNSKPELEIYADDVKCSHGATVGQMDAEAVFYLRARGIPEDRARALMQLAFANEALGYIKEDAVREAVEHMVVARFENM